MAEPSIKPEPGLGASPGALSEEDIYEDAGDLEFNTDPSFQGVYLAKVPKYLYDAWSKLDDDAEIRIGTIRQATEIGKNGQPNMSLSMLLTSDIAQHQSVPKEYTLDITEEKVNNTFLFTEQDLPGFKSKSQAKFDLETANMPSRLTRPKNDKPIAKTPYDPNKRFQPYFRKAIPKRTTIAGKVKHEVNCIVVETPEAQRILHDRTLEAMKPKHEIIYIKDVDALTTGRGFIQPGSIHAQNTFTSFIKTSGHTAKGTPQTQKTARMPQNELLDRIFDCFRRYNYWSMKALRAELQQPEAYLRETLEKIAILAKSGRFATQWSLKPENKITNYEAIGDAVAPTAEGGGDESDMADEEDDGDDDDVKFEDVA